MENETLINNEEFDHKEEERDENEDEETLVFDDIDDALEYLGEYGCKKKLISILLSLFMFLLAWNELGFLFYGLESSWQCNNKQTNLTKRSINLLERTGIERYSNNSSNTCNFNGTIDKNSNYYNARCKMKREEWKFTKSNDYSLITEYDFVCDREYLSSIVLYFSPCGSLLGLIPSALCDMYGRKPILFISTLMLGLTNIAGYFARSYIIIFVTLIITTAFESAVLTSVSLIVSEFVGPGKRAMLVMMVWAFYGMSFCLLATVSYLIPHWRRMRLVLTIPAFILLLSWRFIPESPRWLYINGRTEEARKNLIEYSNGKKVNFILKERDRKEEKGSVKDLFTNRCLIKTNFIFGSIGFYGMIIYAGINLSTQYLSGDFYLDFILVYLVEFPASILAAVFCDRFGRKRTNVVSTFLCLTALIVITCVSGPSQVQSFGIVRSVFGISAKLFITIASSAIFILSIESYPTSVRSQAMALLDGVSLLGTICSPWLALELRKVNSYLPFIVMSSVCLLSGLTSFFITESKGIPTLEVVEQI